MAYITTEVHIELDEFDDEELLAELEDRGYYVSKSSGDIPVAQSLYDAWVYKTGNFEDLFRQFCQHTIGRSF
jgi:hypothetical protein